jgi:hypothetical protein
LGASGVIGDDARMTWDASRIATVARSFRLNHTLGQGDRESRQQAIAEHSWAWEAVSEEAADGSLPLEVVDAMLRDPMGDAEYRAFVAAGPIEEILSQWPDRYGEPIAARCRSDHLWSDAMHDVSLDEREARLVPIDLQVLLPTVAIASEPSSSARTARHAKRPRHP